jgi:hypothetical protein
VQLRVSDKFVAEHAIARCDERAARDGHADARTDTVF